MRVNRKILSLLLCSLVLLSTGCWKKDGAETQSPIAESQESPEYIALSQLAQYQIIRGEDADAGPNRRPPSCLTCSGSRV